MPQATTTHRAQPAIEDEVGRRDRAARVIRMDAAADQDALLVARPTGARPRPRAAWSPCRGHGTSPASGRVCPRSGGLGGGLPQDRTGQFPQPARTAGRSWGPTTSVWHAALESASDVASRRPPRPPIVGTTESSSSPTATSSWSDTGPTATHAAPTSAQFAVALSTTDDGADWRTTSGRSGSCRCCRSSTWC